MRHSPLLLILLLGLLKVCRPSFSRTKERNEAHHA